MHSCDSLPPPPATGSSLLLELGRLIIRSRSRSPVRKQPTKILPAKPSTSHQPQPQPQSQPEPEEISEALETQLRNHINSLWNEQIPVCIEVLLAPECGEQYCLQRALLLERWTMTTVANKAHERASGAAHWLLGGVRSQLHFSQLSAWRALLSCSARRKLSREMCNYKKLEANCDEEELKPDGAPRKLNIVYSIKIPGENYNMADFNRPTVDHTFPVTDIGNNIQLKVVLESLPRLDDIPSVTCTCQKRRVSKDVPPNIHEDITGKLNDLTIGPRGSKYSDIGAINANVGTPTRRLSIVSNSEGTEYKFNTVHDDGSKKDVKELVDDRMHTPCSESGKHKCNCDDESDKDRSSIISQETKKLDEKRLKEIAKYKRRLRKECKLKKLCDSTSSEGDGMQKTEKAHTSIPILLAAKFDRFRAIGCYRNQTYLTLPASRIETKSPFTESITISPAEYKKTNTVSTQTDDVVCDCGASLDMKCPKTEHTVVKVNDRMVRSEANYNLASVNDKTDVRVEENGTRRKSDFDDKTLKKHKCDTMNNNSCDNKLVNDSFISINGRDSEDIFDSKVDSSDDSADLIKRPKLRRCMPIIDKIEQILSDRVNQKDIDDLHLDKDDTVFSTPRKSEPKRQKTFSINEDYVAYEKCDYGTIDSTSCDVESPTPDDQSTAFVFSDPKKVIQDNQVPSPTEMDRFRYRFDSAARMVFHSTTGLPLTSSPAPLRRGSHCFDFDNTIHGVEGIKSALFHPRTPASPPPAPPPAMPKLRMGSSSGLLGSFEESALKGRLEPVATVCGFSAEIGASGEICPPHKRLPVTVFFYAPGGTNAPYMGHINLGPGGYRVARSGTIQVSLFNPHGTLVKMFVVLYDLRRMPPRARTFLRQRTLYLPAGAPPPPHARLHLYLRYLIHLRFMTSKSGKLYLHTDIRIIVSRKADLDTATAHSAIFRPIPTKQDVENESTNHSNGISANHSAGIPANHKPNRVFGGCSDYDSEAKSFKEFGYENVSGVPYELRSFTYAPDNPKYSPR